MLTSSSASPGGGSSTTTTTTSGSSSSGTSGPANGVVLTIHQGSSQWWVGLDITNTAATIQSVQVKVLSFSSLLFFFFFILFFIWRNWFSLSCRIPTATPPTAPWCSRHGDGSSHPIPIHSRLHSPSWSPPPTATPPPPPSPPSPLAPQLTLVSFCRSPSPPRCLYVHR